ncbi:hypothetical protein MKY30_09910 [Oceanobacillus sp. FSL W8-0428]|uniref:hypothetical protein n=1 Tax=Oceanobacillus sp. FSL W8-0428 TaxID=2921715 RepID=UPI0030F7EC65
MDVRIGLVGAGWMGKAHSNSFVNALIAFGPEYGKPVFEVVSDVSEEAAQVACNRLRFQDIQPTGRILSQMKMLT